MSRLLVLLLTLASSLPLVAGDSLFVCLMDQKARRSCCCRGEEDVLSGARGREIGAPCCCAVSRTEAAATPAASLPRTTLVAALLLPSIELVPARVASPRAACAPDVPIAGASPPLYLKGGAFLV